MRGEDITMASLIDMLAGQLGGGTMEKIAAQLGTDQEQTGTAVSGALTAIVGALAKNTRNSDGAAALHGALERDRHESVLDNLEGHLSNPQAANGEGILRHVLGGKRSVVEQALGSASGLDKETAGSLLAMLAPVVMGSLGKARQQGNLGVSDLASMLGQEQEQIKQKQPEAAGLIGKLLDTDGDGDMDIKDIARHGKGLLGKLFG